MPSSTPSTWKSPRAAVAGAAAVVAITLFVIWARAGADDAMVATVSRGELTAKLTSTGTLKAIQSITYRSPIPGRDIEIRDLAPEGSRVAAGDLLVKLDTTDLEARHVECLPALVERQEGTVATAAGEIQHRLPLACEALQVAEMHVTLLVGGFA